MLQPTPEIKLPTEWGDFWLTGYQTNYSDQPFMHYVLAIYSRTIPKDPLVRIQSSCLLGETFRSTHCDCNEQLEASMQLIQEQGGIIFYLDQEGRGHGLLNKIRELKLQQTENLDTVEASERLGLVVDERKFKVVADILKLMHISQVKVLTNNPRKLDQVSAYGITVTERVPLEIKPNDENLKYLTTKKAKLGHLLSKYL
jgi:GTP cyclohydrolase II